MQQKNISNTRSLTIVFFYILVHCLLVNILDMPNGEIFFNRTYQIVMILVTLLITIVSAVAFEMRHCFNVVDEEDLQMDKII